MPEPETTSPSHWFRFHAGSLQPISTPAWADVGDDCDEDWEDICRKARLDPLASTRKFDIFGYTIRSYPSPAAGTPARWLFEFTDGSVFFSVDVEGFVDYLDFLAKIAPIVAVGNLQMLHERAVEAQDTLFPGMRWRTDSKRNVSGRGFDRPARP